MDTFKDYFSQQAGAYQTYRPNYPAELFTWLACLTPAHELAWDCGTGNGQAALGLTPHYKKIYATDASKEQLQQAVAHSQITYQVEQAEQTALENTTVDIVTVSQAMHWFDLESFYTEVRRVLKPNGVLAAWTYGIPTINDAVDVVIGYFHDTVLAGYWKYGNQLVAEKYQTISFPFEEITAPPFRIQKEMTVQDLIGLLNSWSAVQRYKTQTGENPIDHIQADLLSAWQKAPAIQTSEWEINMRVGR